MYARTPSAKSALFQAFRAGSRPSKIETISSPRATRLAMRLAPAMVSGAFTAMDLASRLLQEVLRHAVHQADARGLVGVDGAAGHQDLFRRAQALQPRHVVEGDPNQERLSLVLDPGPAESCFAQNRPRLPQPLRHPLGGIH